MSYDIRDLVDFDEQPDGSVEIVPKHSTPYGFSPIEKLLVPVSLKLRFEAEIARFFEEEERP